MDLIDLFIEGKLMPRIIAQVCEVVITFLRAPRLAIRKICVMLGEPECRPIGLSLRGFILELIVESNSNVGERVNV